MIIHTVTAGDSVYSLSKQYSVPESRILCDNFLDPMQKLIPGQTLIINRPCKTCTVRGGDTLESIARDHAVSVLSLLQNNPHVCASHLRPSQVLNIQYDKDETKRIVVAAYSGAASIEQIEKKLPYITMLHIQNAVYFHDGKATLLQNVAPLISLARRYNALPILCVADTDERGKINGCNLTRLLGTPNKTETFLQSILSIAKRNGFAGIDVQIFCKDTEEKYKIYDALLALQGLIKENHLLFSVSIVPSFTDERSQEEYADLSEYIPLWSYVWDDAQNASPAAPLPKLAEALQNTVLQKHRKKILLGIPTFGVRYNGTQKEICPTSDWQKDAQRFSVSPTFDSVNRVPFLQSKNGGHTKLYFEDAASYAEKLDLLDKNGLYGVNVMSLEYDTPILWQLLNQRYYIIKQG